MRIFIFLKKISPWEIDFIFCFSGTNLCLLKIYVYIYGDFKVKCFPYAGASDTVV